MATKDTLLTNLNDLLEAARPKLEAMDSTMIVRRNVSRDRVLSLTRVLRTSWESIEDQLTSELTPARAKQRKQQLAGISTRARVFYAADLHASEMFSNVAKAERVALSQRVAGFDRELFKWAMPLFGDDSLTAGTLRDISRGTGRRDDAEDVLRLVKLYRDAWVEVEGKTPVTASLLDEAEADAIKQLELLDPNIDNPARELAARAYSAWYHDYNQLRALGLYLTWDEPDSAAWFPGISMPTVRRGDAIEEADDDSLDGDVELPDEPDELDEPPLIEQADDASS